jgi:hypothetical protein
VCRACVIADTAQIEKAIAHKHAGARKTPHLEKFPYGVPLGNLYAAAPRKMPCLPKSILELAKGFEPLTL